MSDLLCGSCGRSSRLVKGLCKKCYHHAWEEKNHDSVLEYARKWGEKNRDKTRARYFRWKEKDPKRYAAARAKYKKTPEQNRRHQKTYRERHPEMHVKKNREWSQKTGAYLMINSKSKVKKKYGITLEQYSDMINKQNNVCNICGKPEMAKSPRTGKIRSLAIDHNHKTGKIRALLCTRCNTLLGNALEDVTILQHAIQYLQNHKECSEQDYQI